MSHGEPAGAEIRADEIGQLEQAQTVGDRAPILAHPLRQAFLGPAELGEEPLIRLGFLDGIQVFPEEVLHERQLEALDVGHVAHHRQHVHASAVAESPAAQLEPDILLLDEVLAVGDLAFQRKCIDFARNLQKRSATILFVSHNMHSIKTMCDRVIYLRKGHVVFDGPTERGLQLYEQDCCLSDLSWISAPRDEWPIEITGCELIDANGVARSVWDFGQPIKLRIFYHTQRAVADPNFIVAFIRADGVACCNYSSEADGIVTGQIAGPGCIEIDAPPLKLVSDMYSVSILVRERGFGRVLCGQTGATFHVRHSLFDTHFGVFHEPATWKFSRRSEAVPGDLSKCERLEGRTA